MYTNAVIKALCLYNIAAVYVTQTNWQARGTSSVWSPWNWTPRSPSSPGSKLRIEGQSPLRSVRLMLLSTFSGCHCSSCTTVITQQSSTSHPDIRSLLTKAVAAVSTAGDFSVIFDFHYLCDCHLAALPRSFRSRWKQLSRTTVAVSETSIISSANYTYSPVRSRR